MCLKNTHISYIRQKWHSQKLSHQIFRGTPHFAKASTKSFWISMDLLSWSFLRTIFDWWIQLGIFYRSMNSYLDLPRSAKLDDKGCLYTSLRVQTPPFGRCWYMIFMKILPREYKHSDGCVMGWFWLNWRLPWKHWRIQVFFFSKLQRTADLGKLLSLEW